MEFLLLYRRPSPATRQPTPEIGAALIRQWGAFLGGVAATGALGETRQLEYSGAVVGTGGVTPLDLHADTVLGWSIVTADTLDAAVGIAAAAPPIAAWGGTVEVRPLQPTMVRP